MNNPSSSFEHQMSRVRRRNGRIFELCEPLQLTDLTALAPQSTLIDLNTVVTRGTALSLDAAGLERILQAIPEGSNRGTEPT